MKFGIGYLSVIPVRREPADYHEQVNQILFGERFEILESNSKWVLVRTEHDGYHGWIDRKQMLILEEEKYCSFSSSNLGISKNIFSPLTSSLGITSYITLGCYLPNIQNHQFDLGGENYYLKETPLIQPKFNTELLKDSIYSFLNAPYQWGGRSPLGIDCSGFTQILFRLMGINLPRDASEQIKIGVSIAFTEESQFGDLAFFGLEGDKISHVGILMGDHRIAHASGKVRIDWADQEGIFNRETGAYTHRLRDIKRIIS